MPRATRHPANAASAARVPEEGEATRRGKLYAGTSGFSYDAWRGAFYPRDVKAKDYLAYYASQFPSVEVHYTFRRLPTPKVVAAWRAATPEGFVFALKAHMRITMAVRREGAEDAVPKFLASVAPLGSRAGPILVPCPRGMRLDRTRLAAFLDTLPAGPRFVFEPLDPSWEEARPLLASCGVAWCVTDTDDAPAPDDALATRPFHYLRLRRAKYPRASMARWAGRIEGALAAGRDVFCFFRHEDSAAGPRFAAQLTDAVAKAGGSH